MTFEPVRQRTNRLRTISLKDVLLAVGETIAQAMRARHPAVQRLRPPHRDWNDTRRETSYSPQTQHHP